jgi:ubiquinone/menaquinone biosynthesis C-methylase UbiE
VISDALATRMLPAGIIGGADGTSAARAPFSGAPMDPSPQIRFDDGAAYEDFMGVWSRLAGDTFLQWLVPPLGRRWADVGCGNGAFTELLVERCAPKEVLGIDPSEAQLAFARQRFARSPHVAFRQGDAMALPWADASFDAAVMALVIFFVPDPAKSVAEMVRVVRPGGGVSSYAWDILGGGFPFDTFAEEVTALGTAPLWPPSVEASRMDVLQKLWKDAGLVDVETHAISVQRTFADFDTFWKIARTGPRLAPTIAAFTPEKLALLQSRLRQRLVPDASGRITCSARANAIRGRVA